MKINRDGVEIFTLVCSCSVLQIIKKRLGTIALPLFVCYSMGFQFLPLTASRIVPNETLYIEAM